MNQAEQDARQAEYEALIEQLKIDSWPEPESGTDVKGPKNYVANVPGSEVLPPFKNSSRTRTTLYQRPSELKYWATVENGQKRHAIFEQLKQTTEPNARRELQKQLDADAFLSQARREMEGYEAMLKFIVHRINACKEIEAWKQAEAEGDFNAAPAWVLADINATRAAEGKFFESVAMPEPEQPGMFARVDDPHKNYLAEQEKKRQEEKAAARARQAARRLDFQGSKS